jgi:hypothetical protein
MALLSIHVRQEQVESALENVADAAGKEFWQARISSNAPFDAQNVNFGYTDIMGLNDSLDPNSAFMPPFYFESVSFYYYFGYLMCAAFANWAFRTRPPPVDLSAFPLGEADQCLGAWTYADTECDTECDSNFSGVWTSGLSGTAASNSATLHTLLAHENASLMGYFNTHDFRSCENYFASPVSDDWSRGVGSQFGIGLTSPVQESFRIENRIPAPWINKEDGDEFSERDLRCNWPQCSSIGEFNNVEEQKIHIKHHAQEVSSNWSPDRRCTWHNCRSKASHKSQNLFDTHINNIHVNPLVCTVNHCKHKAPFRANHDLQRHIATAHHVYVKFKCPFEPCMSRGRGFTRKDKFLSHLKEHHETAPCPYSHCQYGQGDGPLHRKSTSKHVGKAHGFFECALKSCEGKVSRFLEAQFLEHLEIQHAMKWALVLKARDVMMASGGLTLQPQHLLQGVDVRDCRVCVK